MTSSRVSKGKAKPALYTVGHSTRDIRAFVRLLEAHGIEEVVDVRTIPKSRHNPQFNEHTLSRSLAKKHIAYLHCAALGGLRHAKKDSPNQGWRNASFRGYADYMAAPAFAQGLSALESVAKKRPVAIMCAEAVPWRCHRSLIADALVKRKWDVFHIQTERSAPKHRLTPFLKIRKGVLVYPAEPAS